MQTKVLVVAIMEALQAASAVIDGPERQQKDTTTRVARNGDEKGSAATPSGIGTSTEELL